MGEIAFFFLFFSHLRTTKYHSSGEDLVADSMRTLRVRK